MKTSEKQVYEFVFKGLLTEEALDRAGLKNRSSLELGNEEIAETLSVSILPPDLTRSFNPGSQVEAETSVRPATSSMI